MSNFHYLDVVFTVGTEDGEVITLDILDLKRIILHSVKELFGEAGEGNQIDILKYEKEERRAILRCFSDFYIQLRASLSFCHQFGKITCSFHIKKGSASLLSLVGSSENYTF